MNQIKQPAGNFTITLLIAGVLALCATVRLSAEVETSTNAPPAAPEVTTNAALATAGTTTNGFASFQMIAERNIFNANRQARDRTGATGAPKPPPPKVDVISFAGTMIYNQGSYAFFDSNEPDFRKATKLGDSVAGFTLKAVQQSQISLVRSNDVVQLKIGEQLRREGTGDWQVTSGATFSSPTLGSSNSHGPAGDVRSGSGDRDAKPDNQSASSEGPSDALKRLLEKRRQEQSK